MLHKSLSIVRTNPMLTTNVKLVVNSSYELFLESFDSNKTLGDSRYKHYRINKEDFLFVKIPEFFKDTPTDIAFSVKFDNDQKTMFDDYSKQYDDIYFSGCSNIEDTWHKEEFECFAPLYINSSKMPTNFFIFRIDGTGILELTSSNFETEILDKIKCVTHFDFDQSTSIGQFLNNNYKNKFIPQTNLEIDFKEFEFSRWSGIDYVSGGISDKSRFLTKELQTEQPFFEFEKMITDGFRFNEVCYSNILNLKFLFDDTPATPDSLRKYSINRYMGFYADSLDLMKSVSSYEPPKLLAGKTIINNVFFDGDHYDPIENGWRENKTYYVYYNNEFHLLQRTLLNNNIYEYKIISNTLFNTLTDTFNKSTNPDVNNALIRITYNSTLGRSEIRLSDGTSFNNSINNLDIFSRSSINLIKIDGKFHILKYDAINDVYYINSDYAITSDALNLKYYINSSDPNYTVKKSVSNVDTSNKPFFYDIYRFEFTEIVDFDNDIINTDFAWFEYDETVSTPSTNEIKLYSTDYFGNAQPRNMITEVPTSSEYVADDEVFLLKSKNVLGDIWRKNDIFVKWGYHGSISQNDQPYKLTNNFKLAGPFNRTVNLFKYEPNRAENNLDYFYTFENPIGNFTNHSLHLEQIGFNLKNYLDASSGLNTFLSGYSRTFDYFDYLFNPKQTLQNGSYFRNVFKYSIFNSTKGKEPSNTLFRGLKIEAFDLKNVKRDTFNNLSEVTLDNRTDYSNYKFSIIFGAKTQRINDTLDDIVDVDSLYVDNKKSGIDVYINRKYKHILVHIFIYNDISIGNPTGKLTDVNGQLRDTLYTSGPISGSTLIPSNLTAANFAQIFNDMNNLFGFDLGVRYWEIKADGTFDLTQDFRPSTFTQFNLPPCLLMVEFPDQSSIKKDSWFVEPFNGPAFTIYNGNPFGNNQPLARIFHFNNKQPSRVKESLNLNISFLNPITIEDTGRVGSTGILSFDIPIFRYSGPYTPVFKQIQLFKSYEIVSPLHPYDSGNYLFDTTLTDFGKVTEQRYSKISPKGNILKLKRDRSNDSVYPMVDEFGYSFNDLFVFKSTWDLKYHYETLANYTNQPVSEQ